MKKTLKIISTASILLFGILWVSSKLNVLTAVNSVDIRSILVVIYLFTSLKFYQLIIKDKDAEIQALKLKLEKTKNRDLE